MPIVELADRGARAGYLLHQYKRTWRHRAWRNSPPCAKTTFVSIDLSNLIQKVSISSQSIILHRVPVGHVGVGGALFKTNTTGLYLKSIQHFISSSYRIRWGRRLGGALLKTNTTGGGGGSGGGHPSIARALGRYISHFEGPAAKKPWGTPKEKRSSVNKDANGSKRVHRNAILLSVAKRM